MEKHNGKALTALIHLKSGVCERNMFLSCRYFRWLLTREDNRIRHEKQSCQRKNTRSCHNDSISYWKSEWVPKWSRTGRSISVQDTLQYFGRGLALLVVARPVLPNRYSWITCNNCSWTFLPRFIVTTGRGKIDSETWKTLVYNFTKGFRIQTISSQDHLKSWFPKSTLLVLDDPIAEGGEYKEMLDLFTKHSHHQSIAVLYLCQDMSPSGKYADRESIS